MTERQINFTVFIVAFFLISQGLLLLEVTERYAALCRRCMHHTGEGFRVPTLFFFLGYSRTGPRRSENKKTPVVPGRML